MCYTQASRRNRAGFTLIELLVVMAIIALLVSLLAGAVMKALVVASETQTRSEISNLEQAIASFKADFPNVDFIPSKIVLREDGKYNPALSSHAATVNLLQKMFGKSFNPMTPVDWNGNGQPDVPLQSQGDIILQGQHCLVFFLGGIPTPNPTGAAGTPGQGLGFPPNPAAPTASTTRKGPYFQFSPSRCEFSFTNGPGSPLFLSYRDPWKGNFYAYFSTNNTLGGYKTTDCSALSVTPYFHMSAGGTAGIPVFENPQSFQIISAGRDGLFNPGTSSGNPWDPVTGLPPGPGADDQTNFSRVPLGNPQQ